MIIHISLKKDRSRWLCKVTHWEGCISANTSSTEKDAFQPIPHQLRRMHFSKYLISYVGVTGRWGLLSHAQHAVGGWPPYPYNRWKLLKHCISLRSCPSKIVATIQAIVIIMVCRCTHTHTTFNISGLVRRLVRGEQQKVKDKDGLGFHSTFLSSHGTFQLCAKCRQESALIPHISSCEGEI